MPGAADWQTVNGSITRVCYDGNVSRWRALRDSRMPSLFVGSGGIVTSAAIAAGASLTAGTYVSSGGVSSLYANNGAFVRTDSSFGGGYNTNATMTVKMNSVGFNEGTTQFRNFEIDDGKGAAIATFTGSTKATVLAGALNSGSITSSGTILAGTTLYARCERQRVHPRYFITRRHRV